MLPVGWLLGIVPRLKMVKVYYFRKGTFVGYSLLDMLWTFLFAPAFADKLQCMLLGTFWNIVDVFKVILENEICPALN